MSKKYQNPIREVTNSSSKNQDIYPIPDPLVSNIKPRRSTFLGEPKKIAVLSSVITSTVLGILISIYYFSPHTPTSTPTPTPPVISLDKVVDALKVANITFDHPQWLSNGDTDYLPFARGCLVLLGNRRLKIKIDIESIHYNYVEEKQGKVDRNSPNGSLDTKKLKESLVDIV
jgi:hypothetical protein